MTLQFTKTQFGLIAAVLMLSTSAAYGITREFQGRAAAKLQANHTVNLLADHADPSAIAITVGDYVQFDAKDGKTHNIGQGAGDDEVHQEAGADEHDHSATGKESGDFGSTEGYRVQFNQAGTYEFHDHYNPKISVAVIVYQQK